MTPPFSTSQKVETLPLFPHPSPLLISDKSLAYFEPTGSCFPNLICSRIVRVCNELSVHKYSKNFSSPCFNMPSKPFRTNQGEKAPSFPVFSLPNFRAESPADKLPILQSRRGSTLVSTVLRKSVRFFIINIFLIIIVELSKLKSGKWSGQMFSFSSFRALDRNRGKGTFACPRASLEACSLGPSFRKSVSIYPRSAPPKS